ncbi:protein translocase subunit SecF [Desulfosarcina sp.]|uniref:protein translocase subunit SecF n=1 Tax=Desulfosarcina sp. TaxID=2027861 RepID=UPI00356230B9
MQFIKPGININFIGKRKIAFVLSLVMILISIGSLVVNRGPRYGIDFAGGTLVQVKFEAPVTIDQIKSGLTAMELAASAVQQFGQADDHEYLIRTDASNPAMEGLAEEIEKNLKAATNVPVEIRRVEMVGPQVGQDLREKALFAMFYALLLITVYISGRFELKWAMSGIVAAAIMGAVYLLSLFNVSVPFLMLAALVVSLVIFWFFEFKYAMGAIVALIHDVTITVGMFSLFDKEFTLPIVAALLTIIGYSLNDTIIVFDRIRENLRKYHKEPLSIILNKSINETLSRTILTSGTTLIVVIALFILGGGIIHDFSFALLVGILVGTYSSIFVASPILLAWQTRRK